MKIYLVGGAVRDELIQRPIRDKDYVVVGSSIEEMLSLGFVQVGKRFPVFLHPITKDEYALARKERKFGPKHTDFDFIFDPSVTLQEDLYRRDLTINAIAKDLDNGKYIDPFGGIDDIKSRTIQHVSEHFSEDPLRVLRVARFAAQFNFDVAIKTIELMNQIGKSGDLNTLTGERVFQELDKVFDTIDRHVFFQILRISDTLKYIFPEIYDLIGQIHDSQIHPEGDAYEHTLTALYMCSLPKENLFAILCHDFGKGITPKEELPHHYEHESKGLPIVKRFCDRLHVPSTYKKLALVVTEHHLRCHKILEMTPQKILKLFKSINGFRDTKFVANFARCCWADDLSKQPTNIRNYTYHQEQFLLKLSNELNNLNIDDLTSTFKNERLIEMIHKRRLNIIKRIKQEYKESIEKSE